MSTKNDNWLFGGKDSLFDSASSFFDNFDFWSWFDASNESNDGLSKDKSDSGTVTKSDKMDDDAEIIFVNVDADGNVTYTTEDGKDYDQDLPDGVDGKHTEKTVSDDDLNAMLNSLDDSKFDGEFTEAESGEGLPDDYDEIVVTGNGNGVSEFNFEDSNGKNGEWDSEGNFVEGDFFTIEDGSNFDFSTWTGADEFGGAA